MKKLLGILVAALLVAGFAGQSFANFSDTHLIRVVYDLNSAIEVATDLGIVGPNGKINGATATNLIAGAGGKFNLADLGASSFSELKVAYLAMDRSAAQDGWISGTSARTSASLKWSVFNSGLGLVYSGHGGSGQTDTALGNIKTAGVNSYYIKLDANAAGAEGTFAGFIPSAVRAGSEMVLTPLAATGGFVDQQLYFYNTPNSAALGVQVDSLRTVSYLDNGVLKGETIINYRAVPVPASLFLLAPGLLGLVGLRRRVMR